jgi:hypothetical protein
MPVVMTRITTAPSKTFQAEPILRQDPDWVRQFFAQTNPNAAFESATTMAASVARLISVSGALVKSGRVIELDGLNNAVGRLTAAILDLDPHEGARLKPTLIALLRALDELTADIARPRSVSDEP